jgi:hypothetical protein
LKQEAVDEERAWLMSRPWVEVAAGEVTQHCTVLLPEQ